MNAPLSCGIHDLVSGKFLKAQSSRVVTCLLTLSEMAEAMEVHFSVHNKLIYCNFSRILFFFVIL